MDTEIPAVVSESENRHVATTTRVASIIPGCLGSHLSLPTFSKEKQTNDRLVSMKALGSRKGGKEERIYEGCCSLA